jgi:hypothetical protein
LQKPGNFSRLSSVGLKMADGKEEKKFPADGKEEKKFRS